MSDGCKRVYTGKVVNLDLERVRLPNGEPCELEIVRHPGGAAVAAVDEGGRVCLLRQYRHAAGGWLWELPAGKIDHGEPPLDTARRELAEEGGVQARRWQALGSIVSSPGVFTEVVHLFLAQGLEPAQAQRDAHEVFEVHWLPLQQAVERALSGAIRDAKSAVALLRAQHRLAQGLGGTDGD